MVDVVKDENDPEESKIAQEKQQKLAGKLQNKKRTWEFQYQKNEDEFARQSLQVSLIDCRPLISLGAGAAAAPAGGEVLAGR